MGSAPLLRGALVALLGFTASCTILVEGRFEKRVEDCSTEQDGTPCVGGDYCFGGTCRFSFCGDGIVNDERGEECDDGNLLGGDGCEPGACAFSCDGQTPCADDGNVCNGPESCDAGTHRCDSGPDASMGTGCDLGGGATGACSGGFCVGAGCGDSVVDSSANEECDPPDGLGCLPNCRWACTVDVQCPSGNMCDLRQVCDLGSHTCVAAPADCVDGDPCTYDECDPVAGCQNRPYDDDGDGYSPAPFCGPGSTVSGGDCDDGNPSINPGAPEQCNGIDDNCVNGTDDEGTVSVLCYRDVDGDGFGDPNDVSVGCLCPDGYVPDRGLYDCADREWGANPGIDPFAFFIQPYCLSGGLQSSDGVRFDCSDGSRPSFDWDCDGFEQPYYPNFAGSCAFFDCSGSGWSDFVPGCGGIAGFIYCYAWSCDPFCQCGSYVSDQQQSCR